MRESIMINKLCFISLLIGGIILASCSTKLDTIEIRQDTKTGQVILRSGRLELIVETKDGLNPGSLRDLKSGRIYADADYRWHGIDRPEIDQSPIISADGHSMTFIARTGFLLIEQTFAAPQPDVITEVVDIRNPFQSTVVMTDFACGFAKRLQEGSDWLPDVVNARFCDVPYRSHPETGELCEYSVQEMATKENWFSTVRSPMYDRIKSSIWGAEGWAWYMGGNALLISKYNQDEIEWSLLKVEPNLASEGTGTVLRFGGAGRWKLGDPESLSYLMPGTRFTAGTTRYQALDGDWPAAYTAYKSFSEEMGHRIPPDFDPPVHWNELYDNQLWWKGDNAVNRAKYYQLEDIEREAEKAKELGCQCLYLDPGWDTKFGSNIWADDRLGRQEDFVRWLKGKYGMSLALHTPLAPWSDIAGYPDEARRMDKNGRRLNELCCASSIYIKTKVERLRELCSKGAYFLMYDGSWFPGECWDKSHGHSIPLSHREHLGAILSIAQRVHAEYPLLMIEQHDPMTGPGTPRYTPTYFMHGKSGAFDELWGYEYMIDPMDDIITKRAFSLYYLNLAYSMPVYLHIDLRKDNDQALMFWWYASTCRHLGVGGKSRPPVWEAQKRAMKTYLENKRFFTQGIFYGLEETVHAHTLPDIRESVINVFNLEDKSIKKNIRFRLEEIGLGKGTPGQAIGEELSFNMNIPALGHQLLLVTAKPNESARISMVEMIQPD